MTACSEGKGGAASSIAESNGFFALNQVTCQAPSQRFAGSCIANYGGYEGCAEYYGLPEDEQEGFVVNCEEQGNGVYSENYCSSQNLLGVCSVYFQDLDAFNVLYMYNGSASAQEFKGFCEVMDVTEDASINSEQCL